MYLVIVGGMCVLCILCISVCRLTVSNAFDMSRAIAMVRCGGCFWLKPVVMVWLMRWSAVVVDLCLRKPCMCSGNVIFAVM